MGEGGGTRGEEEQNGWRGCKYREVGGRGEGEGGRLAGKGLEGLCRGRGRGMSDEVGGAATTTATSTEVQNAVVCLAAYDHSQT